MELEDIVTGQVLDFLFNQNIRSIPDFMRCDIENLHSRAPGSLKQHLVNQWERVIVISRDDEYSQKLLHVLQGRTRPQPVSSPITLEERLDLEKACFDLRKTLLSLEICDITHIIPIGHYSSESASSSISTILVGYLNSAPVDARTVEFIKSSFQGIVFEFKPIFDRISVTLTEDSDALMTLKAQNPKIYNTLTKY